MIFRPISAIGLPGIARQPHDLRDGCDKMNCLLSPADFIVRLDSIALIMPESGQEFPDSFQPGELLPILRLQTSRVCGDPVVGGDFAQGEIHADGFPVAGMVHAVTEGAAGGWING